MSDNPSASSSNRPKARFPVEPVTAIVSYEPPKNVKSMSQPENRKKGAKRQFIPTKESRTGHRPRDIGEWDSEMLSIARSTAINGEERTQAIRDGDSKAGILVNGKSSMGAGSSAPSSAPSPPKVLRRITLKDWINERNGTLEPPERDPASTSTTKDNPDKLGAALIYTTKKAEDRERVERSRAQGQPKPLRIIVLIVCLLRLQRHKHISIMSGIRS
jgi:hypothetical protein